MKPGRPKLSNPVYREQLKAFMIENQISPNLTAACIGISPVTLYKKKSGAYNTTIDDIIQLKVNYYEFLSKKVDDLRRKLKAEGIIK